MLALLLSSMSLHMRGGVLTGTPFARTSKPAMQAAPALREKDSSLNTMDTDNLVGRVVATGLAVPASTESVGRRDYPYLTRLDVRPFVYGSERDALGQTLRCVLVVGDGNTRALSGEPVAAVGSAFVYGDATTLGQALGCVIVPAPSAGGTAAGAAMRSSNYPYLLRKDVFEFVYGSKDPLGNSLGCVH